MGDIADLEGGDKSLRERIAAVDVTGNLNGTTEVSSRQVEIRLLLTGLPAASFQLAGADQVAVVRQTTTVTDEQMATAIRDALADRFQLAPTDLDVRLAQPLNPVPRLFDAGSREIRLQPVLPTVLPLGKTRTQVDLIVEGQPVQQTSAVVEVALYQTAAKAGRLISRGETLTRDNVVAERIRLVQSVSFASPDELVGKKASRMLRPGEILRPQDADAARPAATENPVIIQPRQSVRVVVRKGRLTIVLSAAEALQSGRLGESIRVRNPESNKVLTGRVVSSSELEVSL